MKKILEIVWIVLLVFSLFAFVLGYTHSISSWLVGFLLVSTFIKGQLVIDHFMGLGSVRLRYRLIPTFWLFITLSLIAVAYFV